MLRQTYILLYIGYLASTGLSHTLGVGKIVQRKEKPDRDKRSTDGGLLPPLPMTSGRSASRDYQSGHRTYSVSGQSDNSNMQQIPNFEPEFRTYEVGTGQSGSRTQPETRISHSNPSNSRYNQPVYTSRPSYTSRRRYYSGGSYPSSSTGSRTVTVYRDRSSGQSPYSAGVYNQRSMVVGGSSSNILNSGTISNNPNCPTGGYNVLINGMGCRQAIQSMGKFICYNYERVSRECCENCLTLKSSTRRGCEYGDRSYQCQNIQPFDCYVDRTRDICCDKCSQYKRQLNTGISNCLYGDLTPRCTVVNQRKHLCYLPENQRLCCVTCPRLADRTQQECKWGDQNPELCQLYSTDGSLRINCYQSSVQQVCCSSCASLKRRVSNSLPGCEYGDRPVSISSSRGILDCVNYVRYFGIDSCIDREINTYCCHTCYQYRQMRQRQQQQN